VAELKTQRTGKSVRAFVDSITSDVTRRDCRTLLRLMQQASGTTPRMWGPNIVGFGSYHYKYPSGREGDWFRLGFSPRKQNLTLYLMGGLHTHQSLLAHLGKFKTGKACLYLKTLDDINLDVLTTLIRAASGRSSP